MCCVSTFPGCLDYAGPAADPRTDCHAATRTKTEYPDTEGADSEDGRRTLKTRHERREHICFFSSSILKQLIMIITGSVTVERGFLLRNKTWLIWVSVRI